MANISLTNEYDVEAAEILRRRKMAELMQQQGSQPLEGTQTVGGWAIPQSPYHGLAKMVQSYAGARGQTEADARQKDLMTRRNTALAEALKGMPQGTPAREAITLPDDVQGPVSPAQPAAQPSPQDYAKWMGTLAQVGPDATQIGSTMIGLQDRAAGRSENREARKEDREVRSKDRMEAIALQLREGRITREEADRRAAELRRDMQQQSFQQQRNMAQLGAQLRPQPQPRNEQIINTAQGPMRLVNGRLEPLLDPSGKQVGPPSGRSGPMSATAQRELIQTEEELQGGQQALGFIKQAKDINKAAMGFTGAGIAASAGSWLPESVRPQVVDDTMTLNNIVQNTALPQLKAIFGGMPTEGERKILLEVQGSVSQPPKVREGIFQRAEQAVQARLKFSQDKAKRLRDGTYFSGEGLPSIQPGAQQTFVPPGTPMPQGGGLPSPADIDAELMRRQGRRPGG